MHFVPVIHRPWTKAQRQGIVGCITITETGFNVD